MLTWHYFRSYFLANLIMNTQLKIFTWHIHGSYLFYLAKGNYDIYIPIKPDKTEGYYGRGETFPFADNVIEINTNEIKFQEFDCILFQTKKNFLVDQYEILSETQRKLPRVYVEHDPPWNDVADSRHIMNDPDVLMVHVTHFNKLMWLNTTPYIKVIEHGVVVPDVNCDGSIEKGIVVINHLHQRGRKLGADIYDKVAKEIPLDLTGMGTKEFGGIGEVLHPQLPEFISHYRFMFNPIRYTSLGLSVCEAMMLGLPVIAFATTEYSSVIQNGVTGFVDSNVDVLIEKMQILLNNKQYAMELGNNAKQYAEKRFNIKRFTTEWKNAFEFAISIHEKKHHEKNFSFH